MLAKPLPGGIFAVSVVVWFSLSVDSVSPLILLLLTFGLTTASSVVSVLFAVGSGVLDRSPPVGFAAPFTRLDSTAGD